MRQLSDNIKDILDADALAIVYIVEIVATSATLRLTTSSYDVTTSDGKTYLSNGGLLVVDAPRLSASVDRAAYKITLVDPEMSRRSLFENGLTGASVNVGVLFENPFEYTIGGAAPGQLLTQADDILIAYSGCVDTQGYAINPDEGTVIASIECASPVANLGMKRLQFTTSAAAKSISATDTCYDQVSVSASRSTFVWGRA